MGGTWIAREAAISAGKFDEITRLAREAVAISLGFQFAHLGINQESAEAAAEDAAELSRLFSFPTKDGASSIFSTTALEILKTRYLGAHGHIAISTLSIPRAVAYLSRRNVGTRPETRKEKDGKAVAVYLDREIAGFAIHLLQK